jgi:protein-S-isoprenylcysteine O-methyltransferase Ste14
LNGLSTFEARVPAPIIAIGIAWLMRLATLGPPAPGASDPLWQSAGTAAMQLSGVIALAAFYAFWRARTTINPMKPERASTLVTRGIYRFTRNPLYLSLVLLLVAYAIRLWSLPAIGGPVVFIAYVRRFHITPEERALQAKFGDAFTEYTRRVRRWL